MKTLLILKNAVSGDNCNLQFSGAQLREIINLQGEANDVMSTAWRTSTNNEIPYYRAGHVEVSELLMHIGFKWWKNEHPTEEAYKAAHDQAVMELVDIMHFAASDTSRTLGDTEIQDEDVEVFYPPIYNIGRFSNRQVDDANPVTYSEMTIQDLCEQMIYSYLRDGICYWAYVNVMGEALGVTADYLYGVYLGKNTLNKFRTSNGQREGTYKKIWNGVEDNVYLTGYLRTKELEGVPVTAECITTYMTGTYNAYKERNLVTLG